MADAKTAVVSVYKADVDDEPLKKKHVVISLIYTALWLCAMIFLVLVIVSHLCCFCNCCKPPHTPVVNDVVDDVVDVAGDVGDIVSSEKFAALDVDVTPAVRRCNCTTTTTTPLPSTPAVPRCNCTTLRTSTTTPKPSTTTTTPKPTTTTTTTTSTTTPTPTTTSIYQRRQAILRAAIPRNMTALMRDRGMIAIITDDGRHPNGRYYITQPSHWFVFVSNVLDFLGKDFCVDVAKTF